MKEEREELKSLPIRGGQPFPTLAEKNPVIQHRDTNCPIEMDFRRDACEAFRARQAMGTVFQCGNEVLLTLLTAGIQVNSGSAAG